MASLRVAAYETFEPSELSSWHRYKMMTDGVALCFLLGFAFILCHANQIVGLMDQKGLGELLFTKVLIGGRQGERFDGFDGSRLVGNGWCCGGASSFLDVDADVADASSKLL